MLAGEWFSEINDLWYGEAFSLKYKEVLYHQKSQFQDILVIERYGDYCSDCMIKWPGLVVKQEFITL